MKQDAFLMPAEEKWVLKRWLEAISERIRTTGHHSQVKHLLRALFAIQRLPHRTPGLNLSIEVNRYQWYLSEEEISLYRFSEDGHTIIRLQYFQGSHHCIDGFDNLGPDDRFMCLDFHVPEFSSALAEEPGLLITDYSRGPKVDQPPLDSIWEPDREEVFFTKESEIA